MAAERHELHELVDELPEDQVAGAMTGVRPGSRAGQEARRMSAPGPSAVRK
jgi:hypothetical protein